MVRLINTRIPSKLRIKSFQTSVSKGVGQTVTASASATGGTPPYTYDWDWGDGSSRDTGSTATHIYQTPGSYIVTCLVGDSVGNTANAKGTVTVTSGLGVTISIT